MLYSNYSLKELNTFGLDCRADKFIIVKNEDEAGELFRNNELPKGSILVMGGGSNILFTEDFKGTIIYPDIKGISIEKESREHVIVSAGAGVVWDDFVAWCVERGFGGTENLSLIPGNCGAVPVQNIGAYGTEVKDIIFKVQGISMEDGTPGEFDNAACRFGYRLSIFKSELKGKYLLTRVFFRLALNPDFNLSYGSLREEAASLGEINLMNIRQAVIKIRQSKLPDPKVTGNAGSFFKNPIVAEELAGKLLEEYPGMPVYDDPSGGKKLAAGWLIEKSGWKGKSKGKAAVHDKQALVLVNLGGATGKEIYHLSEEVGRSVFEKFGVNLEREVEIVGTI